MKAQLDRLFNAHKLIRRLLLIWACWLITVVVLRVTEPDVLEKVSASVATVVAGVIGILATVIALYQWSRLQEEKNPDA